MKGNLIQFIDFVHDLCYDNLVLLCFSYKYFGFPVKKRQKQSKENK